MNRFGKQHRNHRVRQSTPVFEGVERLEGRRLMSATPIVLPAHLSPIESPAVLSAPTLFSTAVKSDRLAVRSDLLKFESDILSSNSSLFGDAQNIRRNLVKGDTSLQSAFSTLHADSNALGLALREDRLTEASNALADESVIDLDIRQILQDKGNATAEAADHAKLVNDRITLQNDLIAGLNSRIATRQADETTISNDAQAIVTAADLDPEATPSLQSAVNTFATDRTTRLTTLNNDLMTIEAARTQLATDLAAEVS